MLVHKHCGSSGSAGRQFMLDLPYFKEALGTVCPNPRRMVFNSPSKTMIDTKYIVTTPATLGLCKTIPQLKSSHICDCVALIGQRHSLRSVLPRMSISVKEELLARRYLHISGKTVNKHPKPPKKRGQEGRHLLRVGCLIVLQRIICLLTYRVWRAQQPRHFRQVRQGVAIGAQYLRKARREVF